MNDIFAAHLRKFVLVFFDDILVYSKSLYEHVTHLREVLEILKNNKLTAKKSKCSFAQERVEYLGHIISGDGVATNPKKITDVVTWSRPDGVSKLRGFLGLTGYYRRFIKDYGRICRPLHNMLKKDGFHWGKEQDDAFEMLKKVMTTSPVLALPNFSQPFIIEADACNNGIGAVLMQSGKPISFFSKSLGVKAAGQSIYEKEALAILEALRKWRHYLLENSLVIRTDQQSLKFMTTQRLTESITEVIGV